MYRVWPLGRVDQEGRALETHGSTAAEQPTSLSGREEGRVILPARRTTYMGIAMRSRLEAGAAAWLDEEGLTWRYEPQAFADRSGQYLPDFEILDQKRPTFLEIKGTFMDAEKAMERMEIIWSSIPDAVLMVMFGNHPDQLVTVGRRWEIQRVSGWQRAA